MLSLRAIMLLGLLVNPTLGKRHKARRALNDGSALIEDDFAASSPNTQMATAPEHSSQLAVAPECDHTRKEYNKLPMCQTIHRESLKKMALEIQKVPDANEPVCKMVENGTIVCDFEEKCAGGNASATEVIHEEFHARYDCGECDGVSHNRCCNVCEGQVRTQAKKGELLIEDKGVTRNISQVFCDGCGKQEKEAHQKIEQRFQPKGNVSEGQIWFQRESKCQTLKLEIDKKDESFTCTQYPCGRCGHDPVLHAACCAKCLSVTCLDGEDLQDHNRRVCQGCDPNSFAFSLSQLTR